MNYIEVIIKELDRLKAELDTDWNDMTDSPAAIDCMKDLVEAHSYIAKAHRKVEIAKVRLHPPEPLRGNDWLPASLNPNGLNPSRFQEAQQPPNFHEYQPRFYSGGSSTSSGYNLGPSSTTIGSQPAPTEPSEPEPTLRRSRRVRLTRDGNMSGDPDAPSER